MKIFSGKIEWDYIEYLCHKIQNEVLRKRVKNSLEWYVIRSSRYRMFHLILSGIGIFIPPITAYMTQNEILRNIWSDWNALLMILCSISMTIISTSKLQEKRINYRRTAEQIKTEVNLYLNNVNPYSENNREKIFAKNLEKIIYVERMHWEEMFQKKEENKSDIQ